MTIGELIKELMKCNLKKEITIFDENSIPYRIVSVMVDNEAGQELSNITITPIEEV